MVESAGSPANTTARQQEDFWLFAILFISFALRIFFINVPLERDEGLYAYIGQEILRGHLPYQDVIDHKPPGIHFIYALMILIGGPSSFAIRFFTSLYSLITVYLVHRTAKSLFGSTAGLLAALFFAVFNSGPMVQAFGSNTETFLILPLLACFYCIIPQENKLKAHRIVLSGGCAALSMLIKTVALPIVLFVFAYLLYRAWKTSGVRMVLRDAALFTAPILVLTGAVCGWFYAKGGWQAFVFWNLSYNKTYGANASIALRIFIIKRTMPFLIELLPLLLLGITTIIELTIRKRNRTTLLMAGLLLTSFVAVAMPGRFYQHYFILLIPPLSILSGVGICKVFLLPPMAKWSTIAVLIALLFHLGTKEFPFFFKYSPAVISAITYQEDFSESAEVGSYLKLNTSPKDFIFQWGFSPEIYFYANRRSSSPFTANSFVEEFPDYALATQALIADLSANKPKFIVIGIRNNTPAYQMLKSFLNANYSLDRMIRRYELFRLKEQSQ